MKARPTPPLSPARLPTAKVPASERGAEDGPPRIERDTPNVELRLSIGRSGIGFELARPADAFGLATVPTLDLRLPGMRFPLDVSGGVARFRHRRGELVALTVEIDRHRAMRWAAPRLRGIVSVEAPELWVRARHGAATIALIEPERIDLGGRGDRGTPRILAFELVMLPHERDLRFVVTQARGTGLSAPPMALALAAAEKLLQTTATRATRAGALFTLPEALGRMVRHLLPEAGVRSPSIREARWSAMAAVDDAWILQARADGTTLEPSEEAVRASEVARLARAADDARAAGDFVQARALDLVTLGGAARHPEIARRIAEIDHAAQGADGARSRSEAALQLLREVERDRYRGTEASQSARGTSGTLRAELLEATMDLDGARAAYVRAGETEEVPALAAEAFVRAARLLADPFDALVWLDRAVAERPGSARVRWARIDRRLSAGRIDEARADVEAIAAASASTGSSASAASYAIWRRAGDLFRTRGLRAEASTLYERALRAAPDDPAALAGLGMALAEGGRAARGATLLARSIEIAEARGEDVAASELALAVILAEKLEDLPAAAARARMVPGGSSRAAEARGLEGRWRALLGDRVGASLAFARLREAAETAAPHADVPVTTLTALLVEAATFDRDVRGDLASAQRHLGTALALAPGDAPIGRLYREIGEALAPRAAQLPPPPTRETPSAVAATSVGAVTSALAPSAVAFPAEPLEESAPRTSLGGTRESAVFDEAIAAARVEELTAQLRARPEDDDVVDELSRLLTALDRGFDLLALLSARLEDAPPDVRTRLLPRQRAVLARLAEEADRDGRGNEAAVFRDALEMLES
jgi:tetratricopeptide (TPR) repeat protein